MHAFLQALPALLGVLFGAGATYLTWIAAIEASSQARRGFYAAVRHDLGIPTTGSTEVFEWQMTKYLLEKSAAAD
ncbi:hypothetical protein ABH926_006291 [Catenulispora sp. GP43]|uniref:hypothetical protein n=1 Tax=Catenulispora sp. GP43 TaxID=3156263 RepID=UPI0035115461